MIILKIMFTDKHKISLIILLAGGFLSYTYFLYSALPVKNTIVNKEISHGKLLWQQYNCGSCHQVYGLGGYLGPDLTNVYSKRGPQFINVFLKTGTTIMPDFHLQENEVNSLLAFLKNIDASGTADPRTFTINKDGTITQKRH